MKRDGVSTNPAWPALLVLMLSAWVGACSTTTKPQTETAPQLIAQHKPAQSIVDSPAAELEEAKGVLKRVFKDAVQLDSRRKPSFVVGDFNGDYSQDIAIVIKPEPHRLQELNQELPNWILKDPFEDNRETRIPRLRIAAHETFLAVVHGFGAHGWRDSQATQTFLLRNAAGSEMKAYAADDVKKNSATKDTPYLRGDVISQVVSGASGYLYYTGAGYSWYDPNTFQREAADSTVHLRAKKTN